VRRSGVSVAYLDPQNGPFDRAGRGPENYFWENWEISLLVLAKCEKGSLK